MGDYLLGLAGFAATWGGSGVTAGVLARRLLPRLDPAPRWLAAALIFIAVLIAEHLIPGMLGILSPAAVAFTAVVAAVAAWRFVPAAAASAESSPAPAAGRPGTALGSLAAALGVAAALVWLVAALVEVRGQAPLHVDALSFALPGVAGWIRSGSIWHVGQFLPFLQVRTYPNNGDVLALAAMLPWRDDAFLRPLALPLLGMTAAAVYATGRELRAPASTALLFGAAVMATRVAGASALFDLKPDAVMYATFSAGVLFAVRHGRTGMRVDLVLAGLGFGLALGSRWYGLTTVAVVVAVWMGTLLLARRPLRSMARDTALVAAVVLAAGAFWLLRNLVLTGNPLYPVKLELFGVTVADAPRDIFTEKFGFTVAERLGQPGFVTGDLMPSLWRAFGPAGLALLAGTLAAPLLMARRGVRGRVLAPAVAAAMVSVSYTLLPAGAQGFEREAFTGIVEGNMRWLMPAAILAAGPAAWAVGRLRRSGAVPDLILLACVVLTLQRTFSPELRDLAFGTVAVVLAAGAWRVAPRLRLGGGGRTLALGAAAAIVLAVAGYAHERSYDRHRYVAQSAAVDWVNAHAPSGRTIGVTGNWSASRFVPIYPLFGPRLGNDVAYVGPTVQDQLREYTSAGPFTRALRRGRFDLLAVGTLSRPNLEHFTPQRRLPDPEEARWAESAGYTEVARDADFVLLARGAVTAGLDWRR